MRSKSINWKKQTQLFMIGVSGLLMMVTHQNCGNPDLAQMQMNAADGGSSVERGSPVSVINPVNTTTGLEFQHKAVQVQSQAHDLTLSGNCSLEQEDAILGWKIRELNADGSDGSEFARGFARCNSGVFEVQLTPAQDLDCSKSYKLVARLASGSPGEVLVTRQCPSVAGQ